MARLWSCGFELQTTTVGMEWVTSTNGTPAIETSLQRSGAAALRVAGGIEYIAQIFRSTQGVSFFRVYIRVQTAPTGDGVNIIYVSNSANVKVAIRLRASLALQLYNSEDNAQVGSDSSALSTGVYYRVELKIDSTTLASTGIEARLYAASAEDTLLWNPSGTIDITANPDRFFIGSPINDATLDIIYDDIAINDDSGSYQNSWAGEGELIILRPDGAGDNTQWTIGGTDTGANWSQTSEVTPDDATTYIQSNTVNQIDDFTLEATPSSMASDDVISWVGPSVRFAISSTSGGDPDFVLRLKPSPSGTVDETGELSGAGSTAYASHQTATPRNYPVLANDSNYEQPGTSDPWTKSALDTAQVGVRESSTDTHFARISALWVYVDHKPSAGIQINLNAAQITAQGQALTIEKGAVTIQLDAAGIVASGQAVSITAEAPAVNINLQAAQISAQGQTLEIQEGPVTIQLGNAQVTATGQVIDVQPGEVTIQLDAAQITSQGQQVTITSPAPGIQIDLNTAQITAQGQTLEVQEGPVTIQLDSAQVTSSGQQITIDAPAPNIQIDLDAAQITTQGQALDVQPGAVSILLDAAQVTAGGQTITVSSPAPGIQINLQAAQITTSGQQLDVQPGEVSIDLDAAQVTAQGQSITISAPISGIQINLDTAVITASAQQLDVQPGAVTVDLDYGLVAALGLGISVNPVEPPTPPTPPSSSGTGGGGFRPKKRNIVFIMPEDLRKKKMREEEEILILT